MSRKAEQIAERSDPLQAAIIGCAIVILTLVVYAPAMRAGYIWDDNGFLTLNPLIDAKDGLRGFWLTRQAEDYFPLTYSTMWVEWHYLWRDKAPGYHVVNILLHAGAALLLWRVLKRLRVPAAWLGAMLFAIHPVAVTSVAWITERKNTLSMLFYMASALMHLRFDDSKRWGHYAWSLGFFLLALLSKSAVVVLPAALVLCLWWRGRFSRKEAAPEPERKGSSNPVFRQAAFLAPFFALALVFAAIQIEFHRTKILGNPALVDDPALTETYVRKNVTPRPEKLPSRLAASGWAVWFYLSKDVFPYPLMMTYPRWTVDPARPVVWLPLAALLLTFGVLWRYRGSWGKGPLFALGYFVVALSPVLGFFEISYMEYTLVADHWQYFALPGVTGLAAGILGWAWQARPWRILLAVGGVAAVVALCVTANLYARVFKGEETLWRHNNKHNPNFAVGYVNLGNALLMRGDYDGAIREYEEAVRIDPNSPLAEYNLGTVRLIIYTKRPGLSREQKRELLTEAIEHLRNRLKILPDKETQKYLDFAEGELKKLET